MSWIDDNIAKLKAAEEAARREAEAKEAQRQAQLQKERSAAQAAEQAKYRELREKYSRWRSNVEPRFNEVYQSLRISQLLRELQGAWNSGQITEERQEGWHVDSARLHLDSKLSFVYKVWDSEPEKYSRSWTNYSGDPPYHGGGDEVLKWKQFQRDESIYTGIQLSVSSFPLNQTFDVNSNNTRFSIDGRVDHSTGNLRCTTNWNLPLYPSTQQLQLVSSSIEEFFTRDYMHRKGHSLPEDCLRLNAKKPKIRGNGWW